LKSDELTQGQYQQPLKIAKKALKDEFASAGLSDILDPPAPSGEAIRRNLSSSIQGDTFSSCFSCTTCSTVCPVANNYGNDTDVLGMVPHQMIHAAILGVPDLVFRSNMLWSCLGCYECQQHCPQGVQVADVFYELKNLAIKQLKGNARR
jgi:heterodisulfide reductase subunit C